MPYSFECILKKLKKESDKQRDKITKVINKKLIIIMKQEWKVL